MSVELILWLFSFASIMVLIGLTAYQASSPSRFHFCVAGHFLGVVAYLVKRLTGQLICLSDLEFDYINPYDSSSRINSVVLIEYLLQGALCASFLLTLHWFPFLVMAPVAYYHGKLYMDRKHLVDVTEIFRQLNWEKKYRMIKLAFYFSLFIITIYRSEKLVLIQECSPCQYHAKLLLHKLTIYIFVPSDRLVMTAVMLFIDEDANLVDTRTI
uniref:Uncharacterized protein n=1 Tax=Oryza brachyantha TaxID=4533 RepID=J3NDM6_ORYBR